MKGKATGPKTYRAFLIFRTKGLKPVCPSDKSAQVFGVRVHNIGRVSPCPRYSAHSLNEIIDKLVINIAGWMDDIGFYACYNSY